MSFFLLSIIVAILFLVPVGTRIYFLNPQSAMHRTLAFEVFLVGIVGILEYKIGHTSVVQEVEKLAIFHSIATITLMYFIALGSYYYVSYYSEFWKKWGTYPLIILVILPLLVIYGLLFQDGILDTNHQLIDGKWQYTIFREGFIAVGYGISFLSLQIYLSISHFIAYFKARRGYEKILKLMLLIILTVIPISMIYDFLYSLDEVKLGGYVMTPSLAVLVFIIGWIYT